MFARMIAVIGTIAVLIIAYVAWTRNMQHPAGAPAATEMPSGAPEASGAPAPEAPGGTMPQQSPQAAPRIETATHPGLEWKVPAPWSDKGPGTMRLATYDIPGAKGSAQCAVYYFGPGQGGAVEANLDRWRSEFKDAKQDAPKNFDAGGARITEIRLSGTYLAHAGMAQGMGGESVESPNWALLGAIAEGPNGSVFFKLTGPEHTVEAAAGAFDKMLRSIHKSG